MRRRRTVVSALLVALAVALAFSWFGWGREGLTPVAPASPDAEDINDLYAFIGIFAVLILLSVAIPLALILGRYRERGLPREAEGPQVRGNTRLELAWTIAPLVIVLVISGFTLYKGTKIYEPSSDPEAARGGGAVLAAERDDQLVRIKVEGRQFYWRYVYENGAIGIDRLRVPVDREIDLEITAPENDVNHSFWSPAIGGKMDAIPGIVNHMRFRATETGTFDGRCAELCGIQHAIMNLEVEVMPAAEFDRWLEENEQDQEGLGQVLFEDVCTKCHFSAPEYAPNITGNPLLADEEGLRQTVTQGRGKMPAVGRGWTERELDALYQYTRRLVPQAEAEGEGDGG